MSNCLLEATLQKIESDCNCTPNFFRTAFEEFGVCEGKQKKCMNELMTDMGEQRTIDDRGENKVNANKSLFRCLVGEDKFKYV